MPILMPLAHDGKYSYCSGLLPLPKGLQQTLSAPKTWGDDRESVTLRRSAGYFRPHKPSPLVRYRRCFFFIVKCGLFGGSIIGGSTEPSEYTTYGDVQTEGIAYSRTSNCRILGINKVCNGRHFSIKDIHLSFSIVLVNVNFRKERTIPLYKRHNGCYQHVHYSEFLCNC